MSSSNSLSVALGAFLVLLIGGNFLLYFLLVTPESSPLSRGITTLSSLSTIHDYLNRLAPQYKTKNLKYEPIQSELYRYYNVSKNRILSPYTWPDIDVWEANYTLLTNSIGHILYGMKTSRIILADNAQKGTQLKLTLHLEGNKKLYFKPMRYNIDHIITGNIYSGYDRHNSEVLGYYLAVVLNYKWTAPSVIRNVDIANEIAPFATTGLQKTMINKAHGVRCIYGKCYYCRVNETVCGDNRNHLEGAAILYLDQSFKIYKSPWRRSYGSRKMEWEINDRYCSQVKSTLSLSRLLDLIEVSIFDFLIQNGDRHRYEVYKGKIMLLDNGKGLGNPFKDELDILAPLYQCCLMRYSTWHHMELLSGGVITQNIKTLASMQGEVLTTDAHYTAIERRLLTVYATVQRCIGKYGGAKVFK